MGGNIISKNNSGSDLTLTLPDAQVTEFKDKTEQNRTEFGEYLVKHEGTPIYTFTFHQGLLVTDLTSIALNGGVTFKNSTHSDLTLILPTGVATFFPKGSNMKYPYTGTYSVNGGPSLPTPILELKYHRGIILIDLNVTFSQP